MPESKHLILPSPLLWSRHYKHIKTVYLTMWPGLLGFFSIPFIAEGSRNLRKLHLLYMNHLTAIGDGITYIVRLVSGELSELEEIQLVNCCISSNAVEILGKNSNSNFTNWIHMFWKSKHNSITEEKSI